MIIQRTTVDLMFQLKDLTDFDRLAAIQTHIDQMQKTPQEITLAALGMIRAAFVEGRASAAQEEVFAWQTSDAQFGMIKLSRAALDAFVKEPAKESEAA